MNSRSLIQLLLVALVCIGPMIAAYVLYYSGQPADLPKLANEERQLLSPAVTLPPLSVRSAGGDVIESAWGQEPLWSLIYARTSPCDETCLTELVRLRQVHVSLNRDQSRVRRVYLGEGSDERVDDDPAIVLGRLDDADGRRLLELLESIGLPPGDAGRLYVVDPHGNLVLSYPANPDQEGLHDDLKRLLSVSRIG